MRPPPPRAWLTHAPSPDAGMNKLVVNHLEKLYITSDAATIVDELEVVHPAAKMLARAAQMQVQEVGDGSNFVITFAGELLGQAEGLLRIGVHPSEIVEGYKRAGEKAAAELETMGVRSLDDPRDKAALSVRRGVERGGGRCCHWALELHLRRRRPLLPPLQRALEPVVAAKHMGYETLLAGLVADAVLAVLPPASKKASLSVDNVRVAKLIGGTVADSQVRRARTAPPPARVYS